VITPPFSSGVPIDMEQETAAEAGAAGTTTAAAEAIIAAISNHRRWSHRLMFMPRNPFPGGCALRVGNGRFHNVNDRYGWRVFASFRPAHPGFTNRALYE
jgi:hypothetical protein